MTSSIKIQAQKKKKKLDEEKEKKKIEDLIHWVFVILYLFFI
jgi:uncharacterized membrane protein